MQNDWAYLNKYTSENQKLLLDCNDGNRIVFIGDSITEFWERFDALFFSKNNYINRGISSQTTSQILARFEDDVINIKPKKVVILAGINDIAENNGPISLVEIMNNIIGMLTIAAQNNIEIILCALLPSNRFYWNPKITPDKNVIKLNEMLQAYAKVKKITFVDYYFEMVDENNGLKKEYGEDGVHPSLEGYLKMRSILEPFL